jgi:hypothetical protein
MKNPFKSTKTVKVEKVPGTTGLLMETEAEIPPLSKRSLKSLFTTTSPREKRTSVLLARLFLFAIAAVWILIYLAAVLITYDKLFWPAMNVYFIPNVKQDTTFNHVTVNICCAWYLITVFVLGIWISFKSFKMVGVWEPRNRKNQEEEEYIDKGPDAPGK